MKFGFFLLLGTFLASFAEDAPPEFLTYTQGCFHANSHFKEDKRDATLGSFRDWVVLVKNADGWLEKHYNTASGRAHFGYQWQKTEKDEWKVSQIDIATNKPLFECTSPVTKVELKPTKEIIFVRRCEANHSPIPIRELRGEKPRGDDYKTLNRIHVTRYSKTAVSEAQRNTKMLDEKDALGTEEGWVEYVRLKDEDCPKRPKD